VHPNAKEGENAVVQTLINKGFEILKRNFYWCKHEIDIIAQRNNIVYLFEVKYISNISMLRIRPKQVEAYDQFMQIHYTDQVIKVYFAIVNNKHITFVPMEISN
jgi:Holliday junction resolvase-like predicted endonuclease